jgi:hypothetical protein
VVVGNSVGVFGVDVIVGDAVGTGVGVDVGVDSKYSLKAISKIDPLFDARESRSLRLKFITIVSVSKLGEISLICPA